MTINKVLHLIWMGSPVPPAYLAEVKVLRRLNPGWKVMWWREADLAGLSLVNRRWFTYADRIVPADSVYQLRSDLARYEILLSYGGVYVDLDYRWQRPLEEVLGDRDRLVTCWERQGRHVANGFIAAEPGHPVLEVAVAEAPGWCRNGKRRGVRANRITGPGGMWTDLIKRDQQQDRSVRVLPQRMFHPVPWTHPEWAEERSFPGAIAVHTWGHQRDLRKGRG